MSVVEWKIDREASELVGPCGCRVPNSFSFEGMLKARSHRCELRTRPAVPATPQPTSTTDESAAAVAEGVGVDE